MECGLWLALPVPREGMESGVLTAVIGAAATTAEATVNPVLITRVIGRLLGVEFFLYCSFANQRRIDYRSFGLYGTGSNVIVHGQIGP